MRARVFRREGDNAPLLDASQERCGRKEGTRGTHAILGLSSFCPAEFQTLNTYLLPGGGLGRLGGRHNTVKPQINNHLSVVLSIVPDNDACEAKACVGTSMRPSTGSNWFSVLILWNDLLMATNELRR